MNPMLFWTQIRLATSVIGMLVALSYLAYGVVVAFGG